jgi:hypothetical protein
MQAAAALAFAAPSLFFASTAASSVPPSHLLRSAACAARARLASIRTRPSPSAAGTAGGAAGLPRPFTTTAITTSYEEAKEEAAMKKEKEAAKHEEKERVTK